MSALNIMMRRRWQTCLTEFSNQNTPMSYCLNPSNATEWLEIFDNSRRDPPICFLRPSPRLVSGQSFQDSSPSLPTSLWTDTDVIDKNRTDPKHHPGQWLPSSCPSRDDVQSLACLWGYGDQPRRHNPLHSLPRSCRSASLCLVLLGPCRSQWGPNRMSFRKCAKSRQVLTHIGNNVFGQRIVVAKDCDPKHDGWNTLKQTKRNNLLERIKL